MHKDLILCPSRDFVCLQIEFKFCASLRMIRFWLTKIMTSINQMVHLDAFEFGFGVPAFVLANKLWLPANITHTRFAHLRFDSRHSNLEFRTFDAQMQMQTHTNANVASNPRNPNNLLPFDWLLVH